MRDFVLDIINERQLVSMMNKTKWRELAASIQLLESFNPLVRDKYLASKNGLSGFSTYDWECLRLGESSDIEWLEIDPIKRIRRGRLVEDEKVDFSKAIEEILKQHSIPYSMEGNNFKVWGYINADVRPEFV